MNEIIVDDSSKRLSLVEDNLVVQDETQTIVLNKSIKTLDHVIIFGNPQVTTQLLKALAAHHVGVHYFSVNGKYLTSVAPVKADNYEKQFKQFSALTNENFKLALAKRIVVNKIYLQQQLIASYDTDNLLEETDYIRFQERMKGAHTATTISELIGQEGRAAKSYFYYLGLLIHHDFCFRGRTKNPPLDPANAMFSLGYDLVYSYMLGIVKKYGLNAGFGCIHQNRHYHATLVSDLMEVWRPILVDDTVMQLCNQQIVRQTDFTKNGAGAYYLNRDARKLLLTEIKNRFFEKHHYFHGDSKTFTANYSMDMQVMSLQRAFETGDAGEYKVIGAAYDEMV
ncbi:CRISPR-associated endonuclease Cas1 [Aerococcaceae bacterium NML201209]|nr:CRISPR-associated endonuclease Cas1 [Aerococcaceae bacterium NML201209]MCW6664345.1 CRISPR-associated endonuclease Cas1 [Aerococcaceae bacterium NML191219]MCW6666188.1 CRISPR-associated endonuclease Cas1 [Aerococcaceae bacterium NML190938]